MAMSHSNRGKKGKAAERETAKAFRAAVPDAKRGLSQARFGGKESPDVVIPWLHIENKHDEKMPVYPALKQASRDCPANKLPAVVMKKNHKPVFVAMERSHFVEMFAEFLAWKRDNASILYMAAVCETCKAVSSSMQQSATWWRLELGKRLCSPCHADTAKGPLCEACKGVGAVDMPAPLRGMSICTACDGKGRVKMGTPSEKATPAVDYHSRTRAMKVIREP